MKRDPWAVFLDRDGTLGPDRGHAVRPEQLSLYPGTVPGLIAPRRAGARIVVVSNQSVVARGWLDERGLRGMDRRLRALVREGGARIDGTYYCPHHPRYSGSCSCRKPKPGPNSFPTFPFPYRLSPISSSPFLQYPRANEF